MEKPDLKELKPGMVFLQKEANGKMYILNIITKASANGSFILDIVDLSEEAFYRNYWKRRSWEFANITYPNAEDKKYIMKELFEVNYKR